ncbi:hypothetical protein [uncultured Methanobrevibacter sp.]|uniref:hypothetical protein n=1 Tax=uncultured Methanobrevibacter sp. TaxID=253161 RepID=UPI0026246ACD|nr:hypothetical protein [uncultured Methanobrevibacter sp.]
MKIVTTPMCEEIVKLAGIKNYNVNKHPSKKDGDLAILLSESKVEIDAIPIKLNSSTQIFESIKKLDFNNSLNDDEIISFFDNYPLSKKYLNNINNKNIRVKVYSNFLKDTVESMGFVIDDKNYDYVIYPDYLKENVQKESKTLIKIPSHGKVSKNPFERIEKRYEILEKLI